MKLPTLKNLNLERKSVLLRIDINSPVVKGKILDNPRFEASVKTIKYLIKKEAKITIIAHQGRKGDKDYTSLEQHASLLSKYIKKKIAYVDDLFGEKAGRAIANLKPKQIILLKNVRFYEDEVNINDKKNHYPQFCKLFELYVNEAFSVSHRKQSSIMLLPKYLPSSVGFEFEKELKALENFSKYSVKKRIFILGGAKIDDYLPIFENLKNKNNKILAAGVLGNILLIIKGYNLGYENLWLKNHGHLILMPQLKKLYKKYKDQIILPTDFGLITEKGKRLDVNLKQAPYKYKVYDVGEKTIEIFKGYLEQADYIFMKGPLGFSEIEKFSYGTKKILRYVSDLTKNKKTFSILGGGHLSTTISKYKILNNFSYVSLSGGALIQYISGEKLPGILAIEKSKK